MSDTDPAVSIEATEFIRRFLKPGERVSSKHFLAALSAERAAGYAQAVANLLDSDAYMAWCMATQKTPFPAMLTTRREHRDLARYLEAQATKEPTP